MTADGGEADQPLTESIESAQSDLDRLREQLLAAAHGEVDPKAVQDQAQDYWRDHGPALRAAAASLTEEVRTQTLAELYKWREQLARQTTHSARRPDSDS